MRRTPLATSVVAPLVVLLVGAGLAGCGGGGEPTADPTTASSSASTSASPTPTGETSEAASEVATGPKVAYDQFTVNLPAGWKHDKEILGLTFGYDPDNTDAIEIIAVDSVSRTLDQAAQSALRTQTREAIRREDDAELGGLPAYHLTAPGVGQHAYDEYGLWIGGQMVSIGLDIEGTEADRRAVIGSVLASWTWR